MQKRGSCVACVSDSAGVTQSGQVGPGNKTIKKHDVKRKCMLSEYVLGGTLILHVHGRALCLECSVVGSSPTRGSSFS